MKKYLSLALSVFIIVPAINNVFATTIQHQNQVNNELLTTNNKLYLTDNRAINWDNFASEIDGKIFANNIKKNNFSVLPNLNYQQKQEFNNKVKSYTDLFKNNNFNLTQAKQYIKNNVANIDQFNKYYNKPGQAIIDQATNITQKIVGQFFDPKHKLDLNLNTENTYQDVINNLITKVQIAFGSDYQNNNVKIILTDPSQANTKLYHDNRSLLNIVNNTVAIKVTISANKTADVNQTLQLTNINASGQDLVAAVQTYFEKTNPQDLGLSITSTKNDVINKIIAKINKRFPNFAKTITIGLIGTRDNYLFINNISALVNEKTFMHITINDNNDNIHVTNILYFKNVTLTGGGLLSAGIVYGILKNHVHICNQDLRLNTTNTYQDALIRLTSRMQVLLPNFNFHINLSDPNLTTSTLEKHIDPNNPTTFMMDINFTDWHGESFKSAVHLENVKLNEQDKKTLKLYGDLKNTVDKLNIANIAFSAAGTIFAIAAASFWAMSWAGGVSIPWAVACTAAASTTFLIAGIIGVDEYVKDATSSTYWNRVELGVSSIYSIGQSIYGTIGACLIGCAAADTVVEWSLPAIASVVSTMLLLYSILSTWA